MIKRWFSDDLGWERGGAAGIRAVFGQNGTATSDLNKNLWCASLHTFAQAGASTNKIQCMPQHIYTASHTCMYSICPFLLLNSQTGRDKKKSHMRIGALNHNLTVLKRRPGIARSFNVKTSIGQYFIKYWVSVLWEVLCVQSLYSYIEPDHYRFVPDSIILLSGLVCLLGVVMDSCSFSCFLVLYACSWFVPSRVDFTFKMT